VLAFLRAHLSQPERNAAVFCLDAIESRASAGTPPRGASDIVSGIRHHTHDRARSSPEVFYTCIRLLLYLVLKSTVGGQNQALALKSGFPSANALRQALIKYARVGFKAVASRPGIQRATGAVIPIICGAAEPARRKNRKRSTNDE
jgi:hypothetical protein